MPLPAQRPYDLAHLEAINKYGARVRTAYRQVIKQVAELAVPLSLNPRDEFYWRNYPDVNQKVDKLLRELNSNVYGTTVSGIDTEWDRAVKKHDELARYVFGAKLDDLPSEYRLRYLSNNYDAKNAFKYRKDNGLKLSQKVWSNTRQFKKELELALEMNVGKGKSAQSIASEVTKYLNEPNRLYRRVLDKETGVLRLSKAAKAYHPGQGVYRSSYKNALRLARNETNFSYELSQKTKRQQQDFIVGIEITTSPGHNPADDKGGVKCIDLQGRYPKEFDWTYKWHVNCRCYSKSVLKTREELDQDLDQILSGKEPTTPSVNEVKEQPKQYTSFYEANKDKWAKYKSPPRTFNINSREG